MKGTVNRRPGCATVSGVKFAPTLVPTALSSCASSEASGFRGLKVSFVYARLRWPVLFPSKSRQPEGEPSACARRQKAKR
jgi:hypothetical protein